MPMQETQETPWRRAWQPSQVFWPGESHGQRSLTGPQSLGSQRVGLSTHSVGGQESNTGTERGNYVKS